MKNLHTPRTLADCEFTSGYADHHSRPAGRWRELILSVTLAVVIGVTLTVMTAYAI